MLERAQVFRLGGEPEDGVLREGAGEEGPWVQRGRREGFAEGLHGDFRQIHFPERPGGRRGLALGRYAPFVYAHPSSRARAPYRNPPIHPLTELTKSIMFTSLL